MKANRDKAMPNVFAGNNSDRRTAFGNDELKLPKFVAAAVQASPVMLDRASTVKKACHLIAEAASKGATLAVFPESFIPGYPYWNWLYDPYTSGRWFERYYAQSVPISGASMQALRDAAKSARCTVVMGISERDQLSPGTLYNTNVVISDSGELIGVHRKLVPTWAEKLTWSRGDGSSLKVYDTAVGPLGTLVCGENTNTLARFSLLSEGELIHAANFPAFPFTNEEDMPAAIQIRVGAHCFEGKIFCVESCSTLSEALVNAVAVDDQSRMKMTSENNAFSGIFGPDGKLICEPLIDQEGIVYGEIDLNKCIAPRQLHNITGSYNRFDIFNLQVNRTKLASSHIIDQTESDGDESWSSSHHN